MSYLIRRLAVSVLQVAVLSVLLFLVFRIAPGDYYTAALDDPRQSMRTASELRRASGLDRSWTGQYADWFRSCMRGEFGQSIAYHLPVSGLLEPRIAKTLQVAIPGLLLAWLIGLGSAVLSVGATANRDRQAAGHRLAEPGVAAAAMVPDVILISLVLWAAVSAGVSINGAWLPILGLTLSIAPVVFLHATGELRRARDLEFVRIARSRGVRGARLWLRYILPAAANPLVSLAGLSLAAAIGSSFVVEALTGWPGIGPMFLEAVQARDYPIVQTTLIGLSTVLILSNLGADLVLYRLDPRIRSSAA